jgi:hypothetical protein
MTNILQKIGVGIADFGKWIAEAVTDTVNLAIKIEKILKAEKPLEAPLVSGLSTVISDVEALIAASQTAITADGLNFPADSAVYQKFLALISDFQKLSPVVEEAIEILEGKTPSTTATAS